MSPELVSLIEALAPYVINIGGILIAYLTLAGNQKRENEKSQALIEKEKREAQIAFDLAAAIALEKARKELDDRNKELMNDVIKDNKELKISVNKLQESDDKKNALILTLQGELKTTATECKDQIDRVVNEMANEMKGLRDRLEIALEGKGRAEGMVASTAPVTPAPAATVTASSDTPLEAKGTVAISLDVVPKKE